MKTYAYEPQKCLMENSDQTNVSDCTQAIPDYKVPPSRKQPNYSMHNIIHVYYHNRTQL
jgi:hypothetical protein